MTTYTDEEITAADLDALRDTARSYAQMIAQHYRAAAELWERAVSGSPSAYIAAEHIATLGALDGAKVADLEATYRRLRTEIGRRTGEPR